MVLGLGLILYPLLFQRFKSFDISCITTTIEHNIQTMDMLPLFGFNARVKILENFYSCNTVKKGDFVLYKTSPSTLGRLRRIVAVPGDRFEVIKNPKEKAWNIKINGKYLPWQKGRPYFFGSLKGKPILRTAQENYLGVVPEDNYILFSLVAPGSMDSGLAGFVRQDQLAGKLSDGNIKIP